MTPKRWQQIGELFDAAAQIDPAARESWLRTACRGDDDLQTEVSRLLAQDVRADRDGLLPGPPERGSLRIKRRAGIPSCCATASQSRDRGPPLTRRRPRTPRVSLPKRRLPGRPQSNRFASLQRSCGRGSVSCR